MSAANGKTHAEVVRASEIAERVIQRIFELRNPDAMPNHRKELAQYKRRLRGHKEVQVQERTLLGGGAVKRGFFVKVYEKDVFVERPEPPRPAAWLYFSYDRSFGGSPARQAGLLASPLYNREIRPQRVWEYEEEMQGGRWQDLLSDPIAVTTDGHVLNGQHRIAAAAGVNWEKAGNNPAFLVVWGADAKEALHADGSRRTALDEKTIATKVLVGRPT